MTQILRYSGTYDSKVSNNKVSDVLSSEDRTFINNQGYDVSVSMNHHNDNEKENKLKQSISGWQVCCLYTLASVMSGQFVGFNPGYGAGTFGFFISFMIVSLGYLCLAVCIGELASNMPFCGGSYGYTRLIYGIAPAFFIGVIECVEYMFLLTTNLYFLAQLFTTATGSETKYEPLWLLLIYGINYTLQLIGGRIMYYTSAYIAVFNILVLAFYVFGSIKWADLNYYGPLPVFDTTFAANTTTTDWTSTVSDMSAWITSDYHTWFAAFPFAMWPYIGVEIAPMVCEEIIEPRKNVPKGIIAAVITLFTCTLPILFMVASLPSITVATQGHDSVLNNILDIQGQTFPLNGGFSLIFSNGDPTKILDSIHYLVILSMMPIWNNGYGTGIGCARQMYAMARSGYFPTVLAKTNSRGVPYVAHTFITLICYIVSIAIKFSHDPVRFFNLIFNVTALFGIINYLVQFTSFIIFRLLHEQHKDAWTNPIGIISAVYGIVCFGIGLVCMGLYTPDVMSAIYTCIVCISIPFMYFILYSRNQLTFSNEEKYAYDAVLKYLYNKSKEINTNKGRLYVIFNKYIKNTICCGCLSKYCKIKMKNKPKVKVVQNLRVNISPINDSFVKISSIDKNSPIKSPSDRLANRQNQNLQIHVIGPTIHPVNKSQIKS